LRRRAPWIAVLLTIALLFSQGLVAAYACTIGDGPAARLSGKVRMVEHMPNCSGMDDEQPAPANLCQSHCLPAQPAQQLDTPTAPIALQPALIVQMATSVAVALHAPTDVVPAAAAPPPRLRFSRLLI
jgi:hypothetical protein